MPEQTSDPITLVISELVDPRYIDEYENWAREINQAAKQYPGFRGIEVIRPRDHAYPEYVVIVKFDQYIHLRNWLASPTYQQSMSQAHRFIAERSHQQLPDGLELWFTLPKNHGFKPPQPAYYKMVILGVLGVYPLIVLANALLAPRLRGLPDWLSLLISVGFVSALLTYPVMPWLTQGFSFWLYPSLSKQSSRRT